MGNHEDLATVHILRSDGAEGSAGRWQVFEQIPYAGRRILDVLSYLLEQVDSSLAFRQSCRQGVCGACGVRVNGKPALACKRLAEQAMRIEPPRNRPVLRDLVVRGLASGRGQGDRGEEMGE